MEKQQDLKRALTGPVTNREPVLLDDIPADNLVGAMTALASEVYILRERLAVMEAELARQRVIGRNAIEEFEPKPDEAERIRQGLDGFVERFWTELARDRTPVSRVDPQVTPFLASHKSE